MKLVAALTITALLVAAPPALGQSASLTNSKIVVLDEDGDGGYRETSDPDLTEVRKRMIARGPLKQYVQFMSPIRVGKTLGVVARDCDGQVNMWYSRSQRSITVCYEFMQWVEEIAAKSAEQKKGPDEPAAPVKLDRNGLIAGTFAGVMLHETGHALFDLLDVPVFGREEDAADEIAAFVAVQFQREVAETVVAALALMLRAGGDNPTVAPNPDDPNYPKLPANPGSPQYERAMQARCQLDPMCSWSDEHGSGTQRFFNMSCIVYGSDPRRYAHWKTAGWVAANRDCATEYQRAHKAFATTIFPFIDVDLMKRVQQTQWFLPQEVKRP